MGNIERLRQCNWQGPPQYKNTTILEFPLYIKTRLLPFILLVTLHYCDVIMGSMAYLTTSLTSAYSTVHSGADQRKHQSSASLAFVRGIHRSPAQMASNAENFPPDDDIMCDAKFGLLIRVCHVAALPPTHMFTVTTLSNEGHWCWQAALIASSHRNRLTCSPNSRRRVQGLDVHYTWRASQRLYVCS